MKSFTRSLCYILISRQFLFKLKMHIRFKIQKRIVFYDDRHDGIIDI